MSEILRAWVPGVPAAKGSWRGVRSRSSGKVILLADSKRSRPWHESCRWHVQQALGEQPLTPTRGPVSVELTFFFPRPRSHYHQRRSGDVLRADAPSYVSVKPDADKLERLVLDALTGLVYQDDAQVAVLHAVKLYTHAAEGPGVRVRVLRLS